MSTKHLALRVAMLLLILGMVSLIPSFAGSAVIGSVAGSLNATAGGQALLPNTVIFSGDSLQVQDGAAVVAIEDGSRMAFGRETEASFLREANEVTVLLGQGNVSLYHPASSVAVKVKVGRVSISPSPGFKTLADVAMLNGTVVVTAKQGSVRVEGHGPAMEVAAGKTITLGPPTARAPQAGGSQKLGGTEEYLDAGALGAGVVAAILAGIAISRANDARDAANAANSSALSAVSAANAATSAANAATSAASGAASNANTVGCALNTFAAGDLGFPSPYTPPSGFTCP